MKSSMLLNTIFLLLILALFGQQAVAQSAEIGTDGEVQKQTKKNKKKNWSSIDFDAVEKSWEGGDEKQELENEFDIHRKKMEERQKNGAPKSRKEAVKQAMKDPLHLNGGQGGTMMFAKLRKQYKKNEDWTTKTVDKVAARWSTMLRSAHFDVKVVNIGAQGGADSDQSTLLLSVDKKYNTYDVVKFVLRQKHTDRITINGRDYTIKDIPADDDE